MHKSQVEDMEGNKKLQSAYYETVETGFIYRSKPLELIEFTPFNAEQIQYLRSLVNEDDSTDYAFKEKVVVILDDF